MAFDYETSKTVCSAMSHDDLISIAIAADQMTDTIYEYAQVNELDPSILTAATSLTVALLSGGISIMQQEAQKTATE